MLDNKSYLVAVPREHYPRCSLWIERADDIAMYICTHLVGDAFHVLPYNRLCGLLETGRAWGFNKFLEEIQ